jgi:hypothetical protein
MNEADNCPAQEDLAVRDYAKVAPQFWTGKTGKALRAKGQEAVIVGLYLMTSPHANMLGLYYVPILFIAHETGLGMEGATKGLVGACEVEFCHYDEASEMVWVTEMASYQVADELKPTDNRVHGVQKDYDALPANPFLEGFYARYSQVFHMQRMRSNSGEALAPKARGSKGATKPGTGTGAGEGAKTGAKTSSYSPEFEEVWDAYPARPGANKRDTFKAWTARVNAGCGIQAMLDGAKRYRQYCLAMKTEPQYIKQPATFFGPDLHFELAWELPRQKASIHVLGNKDYRAGIGEDGTLQ